jgi:hypothetical protein
MSDSERRCPAVCRRPLDRKLNLREHSAVRVKWWAERSGMRSDGYEIAVYRVDGGKIAQVWFYNEPSDAEAFSAVFAFD